ncbi:Phosphatidylglycerol phospholipase C [Candida viswanathii]|uniref:Phosphatidylglycerol phospholipase C n=1 Tax=Candida viswanathii TaxID=5486 RepID=A0A367XVU7_9ASCO|nr:Phosphatidylglycerol phospholipase C [Candida viswanathii]
MSSTTISPVIVGHRGFKSKYPENTFVGFNKCFQLGGSVIETDLWLSKDEVIVISHDQSTKRVFVDSEGNETDYNILETEYDPTLKNLKTVEGNYPLITFRELLKWFKEYVDKDQSQNYKLELDIKRFNPVKITKFIVKDLLSVHDDITWWYNKIQFGIWDLNFLKYLNQSDYFQDKFGLESKSGYTQFDIFNISLNWRDSIHYINYNFYLDETVPEDRVKVKLTGVSVIYIATWSHEFLTKFIPLLRIQKLKLYSWTINNYLQFSYLSKIGKSANLVEYGVISDDPQLMAKYRDQQEQEDQASSEHHPLILRESKDYYDENGELSIDLTLQQKVLHWLFLQFNLLVGKRVTVDEKQFAAPVDENKIRKVQSSPLHSGFSRLCRSMVFFRTLENTLRNI